MLFNLYQISSEEAVSVLEIEADMASLLINFDQARVSGRCLEGLNLIKSDFLFWFLLHLPRCRRPFLSLLGKNALIC